jgi:dTMP kinase
MNSSTSSLLEAGEGGVRPGSYYGNGIPYLPIEGYPGKIIAIEGTDGVGRSTQITLLREWLEVQGYGVVETGWTRSELMQPTIDLAKSSNTLNKLTFVLLYATDFADRLEKEIIPALKAGFIVLSDRYIFTALARAGVRGVDRTWMRNLYGFAIAPHQVFYLKIDEKTLIRRVLQSRGMDYWESGMDMKLGDDIYESFRGCASMRRWPMSSGFACSTRAARWRSSRTSCAGRSARSWPNRTRRWLRGSNKVEEDRVGIQSLLTPNLRAGNWPETARR